MNSTCKKKFLKHWQHSETKINDTIVVKKFLNVYLKKYILNEFIRYKGNVLLFQCYRFLFNNELIFIAHLGQ